MILYNLIFNFCIIVPKSMSAYLKTLIFLWIIKYLQNASCVLVPGGFGDRGVKGMILAAKYARENNVPYLGICLGMQISVIEFARSVSIGFPCLRCFLFYFSKSLLKNC